MIIGIDCGNSYVKIGLFENKKLKEVFGFPSENIKLFKIPVDWKKINIECIGVASVFPLVSSEIKQTFKKAFNKQIYTITPEICNIPLKIKNKNKVGIDRVLNCKAASVLYGYPCIVIDIGTAITIDVVDGNGYFTGGVILPGPVLWLNSFEKTHLIKSPSFLNKNVLIGKNTNECITSGLNNGIPGSIENTVKKIKNKYKKARIILTGGWGKYFSRKIKLEKRVKEYLTLEGINIVINERWMRKQ